MYQCRINVEYLGIKVAFQHIVIDQTIDGGHLMEVYDAIALW